MTYTVSSGTLNLTQPNPTPSEFLSWIVPRMTYTVSSGTLNLTQPNPTPSEFLSWIRLLVHVYIRRAEKYITVTYTRCLAIVRSATRNRSSQFSRVCNGKNYRGTTTVLR